MYYDPADASYHNNDHVDEHSCAGLAGQLTTLDAAVFCCHFCHIFVSIMRIVWMFLVVIVYDGVPVA